MAKSQKLDSFDYNVDGRTITEILGPRFSKMVFGSVIERQAVRASLLKYIMARPDCSDETKMLCVKELGEAPISSLFKDQVDSTCLTALKVDSPEDLTEDIGPKIPRPKLGDCSVTGGRVSKDLQLALGGDRLTMYASKNRKTAKEILKTNFKRNHRKWAESRCSLHSSKHGFWKRCLRLYVNSV